MEAQICLAGAPLLLSTTIEIFFRMTVYPRTNDELARLIIIPVIPAPPGKREPIHPELKNAFWDLAALGCILGFFGIISPAGLSSVQAIY